MYEFFEHTADVGLRARAATVGEVFAEAGRALYALIIENADEARPERRFRFELHAADLDQLLYDWLNELLYTFEAERVVLSRFEVEITGTALRAEALGEPLDFDRHQPGLEVKAVTYHQLRVVQTGDGWLAEAVPDI